MLRTLKLYLFIYTKKHIKKIYTIKKIHTVKL